MEVRQRARPTGQPSFPPEELAGMLTAFGDDHDPLPETVRVLDQAVTDYIIEICYEAESHARYAGRQKLKIDDFNFALRHDTKKLGRVQELLETDRDLKQRRKFFEAPDEVKVAKEEERAAKRAKKDKDVGEDEGGKGRKKGRGRSKSAKAEGGDLGSDDD